MVENIKNKKEEAKKDWCNNCFAKFGYGWKKLVFISEKKQIATIAPDKLLSRMKHIFEIRIKRKIDKTSWGWAGLSSV